MALAPHGQGRPRPWTPAGGGSAPRPLRSCGAEVGSGRVWASPGMQSERGALLQGLRIARPWKPAFGWFQKGFWGMAVYGREKEWRVGAGNPRGSWKIAAVPGGGVAGKDGPEWDRKPKRYWGCCGGGWAGREPETATFPRGAAAFCGPGGLRPPGPQNAAAPPAGLAPRQKAAEIRCLFVISCNASPLTRPGSCRCPAPGRSDPARLGHRPPRLPGRR